ncbi:glycosyltransferase family 28 protein [Calothrix sp. NIES-2100]|uniref:UDP-2,4-diacetamido-2,4, 6-trideoxy-beta-L-altropyranose hydrolase n=1 Tax=Calothrix sp. NIES-2100 TaxID=1954172 RepID=UPI000B617055|nr:glycosyltransferase family 28 protein [Calothrix sp. NIES-2100]
MESPGSVAIRVDANPTIGMGHLRRCITLGKQLQNDGFTIQLISQCCGDAKIEKLLENFNISWLNHTEISCHHDITQNQELWDAEATLSIIGRYPTGVSWVIVDNYQLGELWEKTICKAGHKILAIDDFRNRRHHADVLLSDTSCPFESDINGNENGFCELVGSKFALVDPEFAFVEKTSLSLAKPKQLLISYGGSDPTDETTKALTAIHLLRNHEQYRECLGRVDVVVGQVNTKADIVMRSAEKIENVRVHIAPESLAYLLRNTDILLTAGGNSMVESLTMRKPCLVTVTSDNQALMVNQLVEQSAIISLGEYATVDAENISNALIEIVTNYEEVANNFRSRSIFDHLGASRVSKVMQSISQSRT